MGDVITRFKLETTQYDSKLRDATNGLKEVIHQTELAGNDFKEFSSRAIEAARALGQQATGATNAKDKVKELVSSYNDMAKTYNLMSDAMKKSEGGKALAASLEQLQQRIKDAKAEMNATPGVLDNLASKFTVNIDAIKLFNVGLQAAEGALNVAKDAFFASEATVDEWGRVMDSSKSLYEGFLTALNTGDISGYLSRIDSIVQAARAAYNELDRLGTMKTIQAPRMSAQQTENERMRMMIQTGRYIAPVDGRKASMQNGQLLTKEQIQRIEQQLQNGMKEVVSLVGNEVKQTVKAIDAVYNRQAQELGLSLNEFRKGTSSMAEFDKRIEGYNQYQKWRSEHTTIDLQSGRETVARGNPFEQFAKWGTFRVDGDRYNDLVKLIQQRDQQAGQAYSMQSQVYRTMNRADGVTLRQIMGGGSGGSSSGSVGGRSGGSGGGNSSEPTYAADSIAAQQKLVSELTRQWTEAGASVRNDYIQPLIEAETKLKEMKDEQALLKEQAQGKLKGGEVETPVVADVSSSIYTSIDEIRNELAENPIVIPIESTEKDVKAIAKAASITADVVGSIGDAFNAIEDPAGKVMGTVMQSIASVALGYANATVQASKMGPWAWVAFAVSGLATMMSMIQGIHSATGYAQGGIVEGNSYSGDNMMFGGDGLYGLNAGELVLTKSQQNSLAQQLSGNGMGNINVIGRISGTDILLSADRAAQASGRGQLVTWK